MEVGLIGLGLTGRRDGAQPGPRRAPGARLEPLPGGGGGMAMMAPPRDAFRADAGFTMLSDDPATARRAPAMTAAG